jgi:hypothetical protein
MSASSMTGLGATEIVDRVLFGDRSKERILVEAAAAPLRPRERRLWTAKSSSTSGERGRQTRHNQDT